MLRDSNLCLMQRGLKALILPAVEELKMTPSPGQCLELDLILAKRIGPLATKMKNKFSKPNNRLPSLLLHPMSLGLETRLKAKFEM